METQRKILTQIRDLALEAANGNEPAAQTLYPIFGSLILEQASGLTLGLNFALGNLTMAEEV